MAPGLYFKLTLSIKCQIVLPSIKFKADAPPDHNTVGAPDFPILLNGEGNLNIMRKKFLAALGGMALWAAGMSAAPNIQGDIYGYIGFIDYDEPAGLYHFTNDGFKLMWECPMYIDKFDYSMLSNGWYYNEKIYGFCLETANGGAATSYYFSEIDFETGALINFKWIDAAEDGTGYFYLASFDPENELIYGFYNRGDSYYWSSAPLNDPSRVSVISSRLSQEQQCISLCYNGVDGYFYAVTKDSKFIRIEPSTGAQTEISSVPFANNDPNYVTGLVYSPKDECFIWNSNLTNYDSFLYTITPEGQFDLWQTLKYEEVMFLTTTDEVNVEPDQPNKPSIEGVTFSNGALTGTLNVGIPTTLYDGTPMSGNVTYNVSINEIPYTSGSATPGQTVNIPVAVDENGTYSFRVYVSYNGKDSYSIKKTFYIGNDTPKAPEKVSLGDSGISWTPVTEGQHGGYLDLQLLTYKVYMNGSLLTETTETSYPYELPTTGPMQPYIASVVAVCNGLTSPATKSNMVPAGAPLELPIVMFPTEQEAQYFTVVDANDDGVSFYITTEDNGYGGMVIDAANGETEDDYVFMPFVKLDDVNSIYSFSVQATGRSALYPDRFEAVLATAPDPSAVIETIIGNTRVQANDILNITYKTYSGEFQIPEPGIYYVGVHCNSNNANHNGIVLRNFSLTNNNISNSSPAAPSDVVIKAGEKGALEAVATFTMPTTTHAGDALPADTKLKATVSNGTYSATADGVPGQEMSITVQASQGDNDVAVTITDENGYNSTSVVQTIYCGVAPPADPVNLKMDVAPDMMSAVLSWDLVTTSSVEGGYVDPSEVYYTVYIGLTTSGYNYWEVYETEIYGTSYVITLDEGAEMKEYYFTVQAVNAAGYSENFDRTYTEGYMGQPYDLPFYEDFDELNSGDDWYTSPWLVYTQHGYAANFDTYNLSSVSTIRERSVVVAARGNRNNVQALMSMPRFTTENMSEAKMYVDLLEGEGTGKLTLYAEIYGTDQKIEIGSHYVNTGEQRIETVEFELPRELLHQPWVHVFYLADLEKSLDVVAISAVEILGGKDGVSTITGSHARISGAAGCITIDGAAGENIVINTLDGKTVKAFKAADDHSVVYLTPGFYIVRAGKFARKVVVK